MRKIIKETFNLRKVRMENFDVRKVKMYTCDMRKFIKIFIANIVSNPDMRV